MNAFDPAACFTEEGVRFEIARRVRSVEQHGSRVTVCCECEAYLHGTYYTHETPLPMMSPVEGGAKPLVFEISFPINGVFRLRVGSGAPPRDRGFLDRLPVQMLSSAVFDEAMPQIEEDVEKYSIHARGLTVEISKDPFHIRAFGPDGKEFWSQKAREPSNDFSSDNFATATAVRGCEQFFFESVELNNTECIYGLGERFDHLERRGIGTDFWNKDAVSASSPRSYINIPFVWSTRGWGIFLNAYGRTAWEIGTRDAHTLGFAANEDSLDYFVIYGDKPAVLLRHYAELTGFADMPPIWSFGLWMSRNSYLSWDDVYSVTDRMRAEGIPADVVHLDTAWFKENFNCDLKFSEERFPDPAANMRRLRDNGFRVSLWQWNYVPLRADNASYAEGLKGDYFAMGKDGAPYRQPPVTHGVWTEDAVIDFSNPKAATWYADKIRSLINLGASAIKTDFGEGIPAAALYNGIEGKYFHNYYSLLYNHIIYNAIKETSAEAVVWARSGTAGSQRYPVHWSGDSQCTWSGLAGALRALLSAGASGIPFVSHDIGGFIGRPDPELYIRWAQFGLFSSHSRFHSMGNTNPREPWHFGVDAMRIFRNFTLLRMRLLPYIAAQARKCTQTGLPFVRALALEYPNDRNTWHIDDQYMFGEDILAAPVLQPMKQAPKRELYLPEGIWVNLWTSNRIESRGEWICVDAALDEMPLFVKASAVIPYVTARQCTDNRVGAVAGVEICTPPDGIWTHDDGENRLSINFSAGLPLSLWGAARLSIYVHGGVPRCNAPIGLEYTEKRGII